MKNIKLNKKAQGGFSLVEMLVVIAVIGIIAAIAIPNIGSVNNSARIAAAQRNAQSVASVLNAAIAAGVDTSGWTDANLISKAEAGVSPDDGAFSGKLFTTGNIDNSEETGIDDLITWDASTLQVKYDATATVTF